MTQEECWKDIEGYEGFYQIVGICNASIHKYSSYGDYSWEIIE